MSSLLESIVVVLAKSNIPVILLALKWMNGITKVSHGMASTETLIYSKIALQKSHPASQILLRSFPSCCTAHGFEHSQRPYSRDVRWHPAGEFSAVAVSHVRLS